MIFVTTRKRIEDPTSGMRLFDSKMIPLFANELDFGPEPDTISLLMRHGYKVEEMQVEMRERTAGDRKEDFNLMEACLTDEEAAQECSRCLRCDHYGYGAFRGGRKDRW